MDLTKLFAGALNRYNHCMIVLTFLPLLVMEYNKNNRAVFNVFFTIFIALAMSILVKAAYECLNCILKDKKLCMKWLVFFMAVETFICVGGGHHTWFECFAGLVGCVLSLVMIEWYLKKMNHIKFILGCAFGISIGAFAWHISPAYGKGSIFNLATTISLLLYVFPILTNCNHKRRKINK